MILETSVDLGNLTQKWVMSYIYLVRSHPLIWIDLNHLILGYPILAERGAKEPRRGALFHEVFACERRSFGALEMRFVA